MNKKRRILTIALLIGGAFLMGIDLFLIPNKIQFPDHIIFFMGAAMHIGGIFLNR